MCKKYELNYQKQKTKIDIIQRVAIIKLTHCVIVIIISVEGDF